MAGYRFEESCPKNCTTSLSRGWLNAFRLKTTSSQPSLLGQKTMSHSHKHGKAHPNFGLAALSENLHWRPTWWRMLAEQSRETVLQISVLHIFILAPRSQVCLSVTKAFVFWQVTYSMLATDKNPHLQITAYCTSASVPWTKCFKENGSMEWSMSEKKTFQIARL
jgi:hypothetical protein